MIHVESANRTSTLKTRMISHASAPVKTCLGTRYSDSRYIRSTFSINDLNQLICEVSTSQVDDLTIQESTSGIISRNITDFRITLFGKDDQQEHNIIQFASPNNLVIVEKLLIEVVSSNSQKRANMTTTPKITFFSGAVAENPDDISKHFSQRIIARLNI